MTQNEHNSSKYYTSIFRYIYIYIYIYRLSKLIKPVGYYWKVQIFNLQLQDA